MTTIKLTFNDETAALYEKVTNLTGLTAGCLVERFLGAHEAELCELLALVESHPELREHAANLMISYGPESILDGIQRTAPSGYLTLSARFERDVSDALASAIVH